MAARRTMWGGDASLAPSKLDLEFTIISVSSPVYHHYLVPKMPSALTCLLCQLPSFASYATLSSPPCFVPPGADLYGCIHELLGLWLLVGLGTSRSRGRSRMNLVRLGYLFPKFPPYEVPKAASGGLSSRKAALPTVLSNSPIPVAHPSSASKDTGEAMVPHYY